MHCCCMHSPQCIVKLDVHLSDVTKSVVFPSSRRRISPVHLLAGRCKRHPSEALVSVDLVLCMLVDF